MRAAALVTAGLSLALLLGACGRDAALTAPNASSMALRSTATAPLPALIDEPVELTVPTYEGSGESVHPDVVEFPEGWNGARYWLSMTPYPKSDSKVENPSILVSDDGTTFGMPAGLVNPVIGHRGRPGDYNSDPELVYEPESGKLLLFYRYVERRTNTILVSSSRDGRTWTAEPKAFWARAHAAVSPTVSPRTGDVPARMWYVDAGKAGCKTTSSRVVTRTSLEPSGLLAGTRWTEPTATDLQQPGYVIWHMKVRYVASKGEYWALYAAFPKGPAGCDIDDLFFARSVDGVHWQTFAEPLMRHEDRKWTAAAIYRSSFLYDPASDELRVWLSARGDDAKWRLGFARFRYGSMLSELNSESARPARSVAAMTVPIGHSEREP